jgi:hypothetical protein
MPAKLTTTINKIKTVPNPTNAEIVDQFHHYMKGSDISENHQNNCLKVVIALANFLGINITFYDIKNKEQITAFLDTKVKSREEILIRNGCTFTLMNIDAKLYHMDIRLYFVYD